MKTQKPKTQIDIFSDAAVHDYVSGYMSKEGQMKFEEILSNDESLKSAVAAERRLRAALLKYEHDQQKTPAISDSGIDALHATLDKLEELEPGTSQSNSNNRGWYALAGVAASVVLAIVLYVDQRPSDPNNNYTLLSDVSNSNDINFNDLVEAKKVAQIWLAKELSEEELSTLFSEHDLKPIGRAGSAWIVASSQSFSDLVLSSLKAVDKIEQVSLISYNDITKQ